MRRRGSQPPVADIRVGLVVSSASSQQSRCGVPPSGACAADGLGLGGRMHGVGQQVSILPHKWSRAESSGVRVVRSQTSCCPRPPCVEWTLGDTFRPTIRVWWPVGRAVIHARVCVGRSSLCRRSTFRSWRPLHRGRRATPPRVASQARVRLAGKRPNARGPELEVLRGKPNRLRNTTNQLRAPVRRQAHPWPCASSRCWARRVIRSASQHGVH